MYFLVFFFKQKTAYEMRISDWSSDVCSSDLAARDVARKSIVLLKNEAGALPLAASAKSIAVIGPLGDSKEDMIGSWSAAGDRKTRPVTLLEGLEGGPPRGTDVAHAQGASHGLPDAGQRVQAPEKARRAPKPRGIQ